MARWGDRGLANISAAIPPPILRFPDPTLTSLQSDCGLSGDSAGEGASQQERGGAVKRAKGDTAGAPAGRGRILRTEMGPLEAGKGPIGKECPGEARARFQPQESPTQC